MQVINDRSTEELELTLVFMSLVMYGTKGDNSRILATRLREGGRDGTH